MTSVRSPRLPTLKNCTSLAPLNFCGVCDMCALRIDEGTSTSMWYAKRDYRGDLVSSRVPQAWCRAHPVRKHEEHPKVLEHCALRDQLKM
jgi:hypothetical protein